MAGRRLPCVADHQPVLAGADGAGWWIAVIVVAVLFGIGHWYKGPSGVAALYFGWDA